MRFFVYGGLMKQMGLSQYMQGAVYKGPAFIFADLYFLGQFPGIKPGQNKVFGEIYDIDEKMIPAIDEVEEFFADDFEKSVYVRKKLKAYQLSDGQEIDACVYCYNREPGNNPKIEHGDYRRFIQEQKENDNWIIAYGSNLSSKRITERVGSIKENRKGFLNGFKQVFNVKTSLNGFAYANIQFADDESKCPAVVWKLNTEQVNKLDQFENVPELYHRISMPFYDENGNILIAQAYMANINKLSENLHPEPEYLKHIIKGLEEHNFNK
ncbi:MAG: gamma-glutamylcyclotransferase [Bacteroidales bacterium]|nr:gamma-glutamylcyclotransferase [Bacteroidales bacterium]MBN2756787.1 gamma-glutamylcyclotransferase [Bacteroidales bacterium]